jgi:hypothetical protein
MKTALSKDPVLPFQGNELAQFFAKRARCLSIDDVVSENLLGDYYKIAEFRAPPDSASEEHGITTIGDYGLLHSG